MSGFKTIFQLFQVLKSKLTFSNFAGTYISSKQSVAFRSSAKKQLQQPQTDFTQILTENDSGIKLKPVPTQNSKA